MSIRVGNDIHVSSSQGDWIFGEGLAAADPADSRHLIACSVASPPKLVSRYSVFYVSFDGGTTWLSTLEAEGGGDPACGFGTDGSAYAVTLGPEPGVTVFGSNDGGRTWQQPVHLTSTHFDREYVVVDHTAGPFRGRVYIDGMSERKYPGGKSHGDHIALVHSADGGKTFQNEVGIPLLGDEKFTGIFPGTMVVLSDGTLVIGYRDREPGKLVQVTTSTDGGEHLTTPVTLAEGLPCITHGLGQNPQIAVDESMGPYKGRLYMVWPERSGTACQTRLAYSSDRARSWSLPIVVNDPVGDGRPSSMLPAVAVNNKGIVGVSWYATPPDYHDGFALRFAASTDGGDSFSESVALSAGYLPTLNAWGVVGVDADLMDRRDRDHPKGPLRTSFYVNRAWAGDTQLLAADAAGVFHPFWYDNRTGVLQLWTAPVTVAGEGYRNGSAELSTLEDVTGRVSLKYQEVIYDLRTRTLEVGAVVINMSDKPIYGPLKVKLVGRPPSLGPLEVVIVNATNGIQGIGALWDWTAAMHDGVLNPLQSSSPVKLVLKLRGGATSMDDLRGVGFDIRVLARLGTNVSAGNKELEERAQGNGPK